MYKPTFKDIPIAIAVLAPILIGAGILSTCIYYGNFGIKVIEYLEFDEALLLFFKYLGIAIFCSLIGFLLGISGKLNKNAKKKHEEDSFKEKKISPIKTIFAVVFILAFFVTGFNIPFIGIKMFTIFLFMKLILGLYIIIEFLRIDLVGFVARFVMYLIMIFLFLIYVNADYQSITQYRTNKKMTFSFKDNTVITSNNDTIYLGKSKKFIFFYVKSTESDFILNGDEIKSVIEQH